MAKDYKMKEYEVVWRIQITALSPKSAATEALNIQRSISDAICFEVTEFPVVNGGDVYEVDFAYNTVKKHKMK